MKRLKPPRDKPKKKQATKKTKKGSQLIKWEGSVKMPTPLIRPNPFLQDVNERNEEGREQMYVRRYGSSVLRVYGRVYKKDRRIYLIFLQLTKENRKKYDGPVPYEILDITKRMGVKNPHNKKLKDSVCDSVERLFSVDMHIRPIEKYGISGKFVLLEGYLASDQMGGEFSPGAFIDVDKSIKEKGTYLKPLIYNRLKRELAQDLYPFLRSQSLFKSDKGYGINLLALCEYLNYDIQGKPWWYVHQEYKKACEELKKNGLLGKHTIDKTHYRKEGGVIRFWSPVHEPDQIEVPFEQSEAFDEKTYIRPDFEKAFPKKDWTEFRPAILKLKQWYESKQQEPDLTGREDEEIYSRWRMIPDGIGIIERYIKWLDRQEWITDIHKTYFKPDGRMFQNFLKEYQERDIGLDVFDGSSLN